MDSNNTPIADIKEDEKEKSSLLDQLDSLEPVFQMPNMEFIEDSENISIQIPEKPEIEIQILHSGDDIVIELDDNSFIEKIAEPIAESIAEQEVQIDLNEIAKAVPNKMAFKIGDVSDITGIKPYVLRYWESEFDALAPQKSAYNQRMYSKKDVETVLLIKKLLYNEKFSIAGAKRKIKELRKELKVEKQKIEKDEKFTVAVNRIKELQAEIHNIKKMFLDS